MNDNYFLRPLDSFIGKNGTIEFKNIEVLKINQSNKLKVNDILTINKIDTNKISKITLSKYKNRKNRISKIDNPDISIKLSKIKSPLIMGILNITKDSFYDGNKFFNYKDSLNHAEKLIKEGADIIDIGGESTRPGSTAIDVDEEIKRVEPIIKKLEKNNILISCDTRNSLTMKVALDSGATIINDVSGLNYDKNTLNVIKSYNCLYVLMHSLGNPNTMQNNPIYNNAPCDIYKFFKKKLLLLKNMNISNNRIILDPGIGFGKNYSHNFSILKNLSIFLDLGLPLMVGLSRKSFIKKSVSCDTLIPSVVLAIDAYLKGARILRVHDVKETKEAVKILKKAN